MEQNIVNDEINLRGIVLLIKDIIKELKRCWKILLFFMLIFAGFQIVLRILIPVYYPSSLTFMVNDTKTPGLGGFLSGLQGLNGDDEDKFEKILQLGLTRRTIAAALFKKGTINGKEDFFANHLINVERVHETHWKGNPNLKEFYFIHGNLDSFTLNENRALRGLHKILLGYKDGFISYSPLLTTSSNKKSEIMTFAFTSQNEQFSIQFIISVFKSLSNFYIESKTRKERESWEVLSSKKDSIERILKINDISTAKHEDQSKSLIFDIDKVQSKQYTRKNSMLTLLYAEIIKNAELAEYSLKTATPFIITIDDPIPPLRRDIYGTPKLVVLFAIIGFIVGLIFIIIRKNIRDALKEV